ncbi:MAG: hypothetical protein KME33_33020 [Aetokthonos hydrillicola CCALA 1050]|nr:hypothetical protein [Aetokthonos hydrillicola CCALA 1050]
MGHREQEERGFEALNRTRITLYINPLLLPILYALCPMPILQILFLLFIKFVPSAHRPFSTDLLALD